MTFALAAFALIVVVELGVWVRARLAAAERQRVGLEAFKAELGIPSDRFRIVHVGAWASLASAVRPWRRLPRFEHVHQVHDDRLLAGAEARVHAGTQPEWTPVHLASERS